MKLLCPECEHQFQLHKSVVASKIECPECGRLFNWTPQLCAACRRSKLDCICAKPDLA